VRAAFGVSERDIARALRLMLERAKMVVEPSAVVGLAALLYNEDLRRIVEREGGEEGWDVGVVLSGGNVSLDDLAKVLEQEL
jgi:threonine dehydratase